MTDQISDYETDEMHRTVTQLRGIATGLRKLAPSESIKADALATAVEIRIKAIDRHNLR